MLSRVQWKSGRGNRNTHASGLTGAFAVTMQVRGVLPPTGPRPEAKVHASDRAASTLALLTL